MLSVQWVDGSISRRCLRGLLGMNDEEVDEFLKGPVGEAFEIQDGVLINPRLQRERDKACSLSETRRDAGRMGARATAANRLATPEELDAEASASVQQVSDSDANAQAAADKAKADAMVVAIAGSQEPPPERHAVKRPPPRNAQVEMDAAIGDWERHAGGPMPPRLKAAMREYLVVRKELRMKLWGREMWTRNLNTQYTPDEWVEAYETATRAGWQSPHPPKSKAGRGSGRNSFADLLEDELRKDQQ